LAPYAELRQFVVSHELKARDEMPHNYG
jgi:hypothetical protein